MYLGSTCSASPATPGRTWLISSNVFNCNKKFNCNCKVFWTSKQWAKKINDFYFHLQHAWGTLHASACVSAFATDVQMNVETDVENEDPFWLFLARMIYESIGCRYRCGQSIGDDIDEHCPGSPQVLAFFGRLVQKASSILTVDSIRRRSAFWPLKQTWGGCRSEGKYRISGLCCHT